MDWKALKDKALALKDKAVTTSINAANSAVAFADKNLKNTPVALKNIADFEKVKNDKILAIIAGSLDNAEYKKILAKMPLLLSYAWSASATLRTCDLKESAEVAKLLEATVDPTLFIYKKGEFQKKIEVIDEINAALGNLTQFI